MAYLNNQTHHCKQTLEGRNGYPPMVWSVRVRSYWSWVWLFKYAIVHPINLANNLYLIKINFIILVSTGPSEADFSYEHVYIGTANCQANEADELAFNRGDVIYILSKVDPHWWIGYLGEKVGLVPSELMIAGFAH